MSAGHHSRPLHGHHAVVTGGAQGLGLAIARRFLRDGCTVTLWDVSAQALDRAVDMLGDCGPVRTQCVDVSDAAQVTSAAEASIAGAGAVTVLVNNAGVLGPIATTWDTAVADWRRVLDINLTGAFVCSRALVPQMPTAPNAHCGRVIHVASVAGKEGNAMNAAYSASKAGLIALTKSMAKELATAGVLVNCITPSAADTAVFAGLAPALRAQVRDALLARVPMGRFVEADEVAAMASWLAGPDCSFSTGAVFDISGGRSVY